MPLFGGRLCFYCPVGISEATKRVPKNKTMSKIPAAINRKTIEHSTIPSTKKDRVKTIPDEK
jgi:hypothetical protein